ncbi:MAG: hypothetical protein JSS02_16215, partial [Planctomycetes bacterium]|nr:hypothetical protein [Planctomycetota bacterium]
RVKALQLASAYLANSSVTVTVGSGLSGGGGSVSLRRSITISLGTITSLGKITSHNSLTTAGQGLPVVVASANFAGVNAAAQTICSFTDGNTDAVLETFTRARIVSAQEDPADTPIDTVINSRLGFMKQEFPRQPGILATSIPADSYQPHQSATTGPTITTNAIYTKSSTCTWVNSPCEGNTTNCPPARQAACPRRRFFPSSRPARAPQASGSRSDKRALHRLCFH